MNLWQLFLVIAGGAIGSGGRFLANVAAERIWKFPGNPLATLAVNVCGCFLIALISANPRHSANARIFLNVGIMGGLTTYSSFNQALVDYLRRGDYTYAFANALITFAVCLAAGFAGFALGSPRNA